MLKIHAAVLAASLFLTGCAYKLTMRAKDGERLDGRWRFAREGSALLQVVSAEGEVLVGVLTPTARGVFFENYQNVFGMGAIAAESPNLSVYGQGFWALPGTTNVLADVAFGESFDGSEAPSIVGPLLYWMAYLQGDRRTSMQCFLIRSNHSTRGLGRCKGIGGKEYTVQF